jgi:hypothetical protein
MDNLYPIPTPIQYPYASLLCMFQEERYDLSNFYILTAKIRPGSRVVKNKKESDTLAIAFDKHSVHCYKIQNR